METALRARMARAQLLFGTHLLAVSQRDGQPLPITVREFDLCAADIVRDHPREAALLLSSLAALDMRGALEPIVEVAVERTPGAN